VKVIEKKLMLAAISRLDQHRHTSAKFIPARETNYEFVYVAFREHSKHNYPVLKTVSETEVDLFNKPEIT
jgi:hypothetical protein